MRLGRPCLVAFAPLLAAGCGPATPAPVVKAPPVTKPEPQAAGFESPARWILHPTKVTRLGARLDLGALTLYGGEGGERWLDKRDGSPPQAASTLIPEPIVAMARGKAGKGVVVVGESGTVYVTSDPLGPVESKRAPKHALRSPSAGKAAIVAIDRDAIVRTTDGGEGWTRVELPGMAGALVQVALDGAGLGLALAAPQRAWVTEDDGATWKPLPTPGVGARRLVADVNGDLVIEGVEASAILRGGPVRLERILRAPKSDGFELATPPGVASMGYAKAVADGRGAFLDGGRYVEAVKEPDDPTRWRLAYGRLGEIPEPRKVPELAGCDHVWVAGDAKSLWAACDQRNPKAPAGAIGSIGGKPSPPSAAQRAVVRVLRSDDEGKTWREEANTASRHGEKGQLWVAPDGTLIVDGACKRSKSECWDSPPVVRPAGAKSFAKLGVGRVQQIASIAFPPAGSSAQAGRAYALGRAPGGPLLLLVSKNGGKDFARVALPAVDAADKKGATLSPSRAEPGTVSVDPSGTIVATARASGEWVVYTSDDDGATVRARTLPFKADALSMSGKRGFAWERHGKGYETSDAGTTWSEVIAPAFHDVSAIDRVVACGPHGCFVGDRAVRVGWGGGAAASTGDAASGSKVASASPLSCTAEGEWKPLGELLSAPTAYEAEIAKDVRWMGIRHDRAKGSVAVVLAKTGPKGVETKEVALFGPAAKDTATAVLPQIEGAAAIRYAFKRAAPPKPDPKDKDKKKPLSGPILDDQKVDVELAWYVASTGKVHRAKISGAGPLDPRDVVGTAKDAPSLASVGLLSIAQGGVHVRPFATKGDVPLWFVHEGGKVEKLPWPELPQKDLAGAPLPLRVDAIRAGGRSVLLGVAGAQLVMQWANDAANGWESRTWGLWPDAKSKAEWDFTYLPSAIGPRPAIVVQSPGAAGLPAGSWAAAVKGLESDPSEVVALPSQKDLADPPAACGASESARVVVPFAAGTRHPLTVSIDGVETLLATGSAVLRGDGASACVVAYEARPLATKKPATPAAKSEDALGAILPWADKEHAFVFRTAPTGEVAVRSLRCVEAKELPSGLDGAEGFGPEP